MAVVVAEVEVHAHMEVLVPISREKEAHHAQVTSTAMVDLVGREVLTVNITILLNNACQVATNVLLMILPV
jgi:hypothetical protein